MGDRMDAAEERRFRRRQAKEDLELEKAERLAEELEIKAEQARVARTRRYEGR
jgi:hypothetical protein